MTIVSEKSIEQAIEKIEAVPEEMIQEYIDNIAKLQPSILAYAMASGNDLKQEHAEDLLYYTLIVFEAFHIEAGIIPEVTENIITSKEENYIKNLELLDNTEDYENSVLDIMNATSQPALLSFLVNNLMNTEEEATEEEIAEEDGVLFSALQIIVEAFNTSINPE